MVDIMHQISRLIGLHIHTCHKIQFYASELSIDTSFCDYKYPLCKVTNEA